MWIGLGLLFHLAGYRQIIVPAKWSGGPMAIRTRAILANFQPGFRTRFMP